MLSPGRRWAVAPHGLFDRNAEKLDRNQI